MIKKAIEVLQELDVDSPQFFKIYLLLGDADEYLKDQISEKLKRKFTQVEDSYFSTESFYGDQFDFQSFRESALSPSFFGRKVIVLKSAENLKDAEMLRVLSIDYPETVAIVIMSKALRVPDIHNEKNIVVITDYSVDFDMKAKWITNKFKDYGKEVSKEAINELIERLDDNLTEMSKDIERLALYVGDRKRVDKKDVAEVVEEYSEVDVHNFLGMILEKKAEKLIKAFENFVDEDPIRAQILLSVLQVSVLSLLVIKDISDKEGKRKLNFNDIHKELFGYYLPKKGVNNLQSLAEQFTKKEILKVYNELLEFDAKNKAGEVHLPLLLRNYIQKVKIS